MPELIHKGVIEEDRWHTGHIKSLEQWLELPGKAATAVCLQQDEPPTPLFEHLAVIGLVVINFSNFMDGRSFSYARELRDRGYTGELRASGNFLADQLHYLQRCGFDSFEFDDDIPIEDALAQLAIFDEHYQAATDEPEPLFRRRA